MGNLFIKNMTTATIGLSIPEINFKRSLAPNRSIPIDEKIAKELEYDAGAVSMLRNGAFIIYDEDDMVDSRKMGATELVVKGLERGTDDAMGTEQVILSEEEALKVVREGSVSDFTKAIKSGSDVTKMNLKEAVISLQKLDPVYVKLIKDYVGVDVLKAIQLKSQQTN